MTKTNTQTKTQTKPVQNFAIIGAGMAGIACARTLMQAGHRVTVFEKSRGTSGRMSTRATSFGNFDHGAQYFTVRDDRFAQALATTPNICKPWSANAVRVLDPMGRVIEAGLPGGEALRQQVNAIETAEVQLAAVATFFDALAQRMDRLPPAPWQTGQPEQEKACA